MSISRYPSVDEEKLDNLRENIENALFARFVDGKCPELEVDYPRIMAAHAADALDFIINVPAFRNVLDKKLIRHAESTLNDFRKP